jgi:hypothetical protein
MNVWVDSHRGPLGYEVRLAQEDREGVMGIRIGSLSYDQPFRYPWRGWCAIPTCKELGGTDTRAQGAALLRDHWLGVHG